MGCHREPHRFGADFVLVVTALVGACGPLISPGFVQIAGVLDVSINEVAGEWSCCLPRALFDTVVLATNAALVLSLGCVMFFQSAAAIKYGRRPVCMSTHLRLQRLARGLHKHSRPRWHDLLDRWNHLVCGSPRSQQSAGQQNYPGLRNGAYGVRDLSCGLARVLLTAR